ncbi:MAG: RNA 2',3'-cyclic phosphodiesterase [bacterium]
MRCFVAVETSPEVRRDIGRLQQELRACAPGVRWVRPEAMHLTLAFLGEVDADFVAAARGPLAAACAGHAAFAARPAGLGAFGSPRRARVLWVGMDRGRDELVRLARSVNDALRAVGFRPEARPFSPHLTLGRLREPADLSAATAREYAAREFAVERVVLFESELRPEGPRYSALAEFPLAARA